jgi:hypothetical protein
MLTATKTVPKLIAPNTFVELAHAEVIVPQASAPPANVELPKTCKTLPPGAQSTLGTKLAADVLLITNLEVTQMPSTLILTDHVM